MSSFNISTARELIAKTDGLNAKTTTHLTEARGAIMWAREYVRQREFAEARAARAKGENQ